MDPSHLVTPPRAHPSGSISSGLGESMHTYNLINEPWFMILIVIILVVLLVSTAVTIRFLYRRRKNLSKGLGHLSGELFNKYKSRNNTSTSGINIDKLHNKQNILSALDE